MPRLDRDPVAGPAPQALQASPQPIECRGRAVRPASVYRSALLPGVRCNRDNASTSPLCGYESEFCTATSHRRFGGPFAVRRTCASCWARSRRSRRDLTPRRRAGGDAAGRARGARHSSPDTRRADHQVTYHDKGSMAIIGRGSAIADLVWTRFDGLLAWFAWLFIHILMLIGFRYRLAVLFSGPSPTPPTSAAFASLRILIR